MDGAELNRWNERAQEIEYLRGQNRHLHLELNACRPALYRADMKIDRLEQRNQKLTQENKLLKQKLADLTAQLRQQKTKLALPSFVKANVPQRPPRKPGRKVGHPAALRPMPMMIDVHQ